MTGPLATTVHATAVISPRAELSDGVKVGPYAVVSAGAFIGRGTVLDAHVVVKGTATIGADCRLHAGVVVGDDPQDLSFAVETPSRVLIGDRTVLREHVTVHRATIEDGVTQIGAGCLLMGGSHVAHDCVLGDEIVLCNSALVAGHVEIEDRAFISGNTVIHQFCRVGRSVMLSGVSGIGKDVGPYLTVAGRSDVVGLNAVGMRRAGMDVAARARVKEAYRGMFGSDSLGEGLAAVQALSPEHPEIQEILEFYGGSRRGYSRPVVGHVFGG